jgi:hypothetical protein
MSSKSCSKNSILIIVAKSTREEGGGSEDIENAAGYEHFLIN